MITFAFLTTDYITNFPISQREKQAQRDTGSAQVARISLCLLLNEGAGCFQTHRLDVS